MSSPGRITTQCSASSTWGECRCSSGSFWRRSDPGDRVLISRTAHAEATALPEREKSLALLAGAFVSEGWVSSGRAGFNNVDQDFFDQVVEAYDAIAGGPRYVSSREIASGSVIHELDIQNLDHLRSSPVVELTGVAREKHVPEFVWNSSSGFKRAFLRALFTGDGSSSRLPRNTIQISYSTYSEKLASEVQLLLLEAGVVSRVCRYEKGEFKVVISNRRDARLFSANVGFLGRKQEKLERDLSLIPQTSRALSHDHVPFMADYIRSDNGSKWSDRDWLTRHNVDRIERWEQGGTAILDRIASQEVRDVVTPLVTGDYFYAEVESVVDAGVQPVYSVRVDTDDHSFLTNGFVSHNTEARLARLSTEMLRDIEADTVEWGPNYDESQSRAAGAAGPLPQPAGQRLSWDRGRHGDQHPTAQPERVDRRGQGIHRQPRHRPGRADGARQGPRLPRRRNHERRRDSRRLRLRPRLGADPGPRPRRAAEGRSRRDHRHRAPLPWSRRAATAA